ncbi:MAG: OmpH family outer membrane protein [Pseudomonadota bacterium]
MVDQERLFSRSEFGAAVAAIAEEASEALAAENRGIEAALGEEERSLTEQRPDLTPEEFRALADAFDQKVQTIRAEQDAKTDSIGTRFEGDRRRFFQAIAPVLAEIMRERQAAVIIDARTTLLSARGIDITEIALSRINDALEANSITATPFETGD